MAKSRFQSTRRPVRRLNTDEGHTFVRLGDLTGGIVSQLLATRDAAARKAEEEKIARMSREELLRVTTPAKGKPDDDYFII
jgi:hypothetical protein